MSASEADSWEALLAELERRRAFSLTGGGADRVEREHGRGRLVARERIDLLADAGSFRELGGLATTPAAGGEQLPSSLVCGICRIEGRPVAVAAEDFTVSGGGVGVHLARLKGSWGGASSSIQAILSSVGQSPERQIAAIANSDWASSHYFGGASLRGTYDELGGMTVQAASAT